MDDLYVAEVLAKEARDSSQKYSTQGLGAYMPRKSASNAPKPNTRFLRHLIKETDNHNAALKRKEEREARERMREMKEQSAAASTSTARSTRGQDPSRARDSERPRREDREDRRRRRSRSASTDRDRSRRRRRRDEDRDRSREAARDGTERRREHHRHHSSRKDRRDRDRSYSKSRSRSPRKERTSRSHRSERSRRSESPPHHRSSHSHRAPRERDRRSRNYNEKSSRKHRLSPLGQSADRKRKSPSSPILLPKGLDNDSDPLEDLVGPLPAKEAPVRSRGRGAYRVNASNIDSHFASDYNPALDIQPDDDHEDSTKHSSRRPVSGLMTGEDDWDTAMEALRDRARWRQKGEERLRAAGIGEETIDRWKTESASAGVSGERQPEDVRWSKEGEGREWDRGKFMNDDGHIDVRAAWS
ncbi:hypothetical protein N7486_000644 [Penicillium sp. IBT 16267x]|nr:hypothetical protein N7486_000644 [Penicillium sp. IBT 16267x]